MANEKKLEEIAEKLQKIKKEPGAADVGTDGLPRFPEKTAPDMSPLKLLPSEAGKCRLLLVRHGESLGNAVRAFLGHTDLDLSERGYEQARRTAQLLKSVDIDKIYSSDLKRAFSTGCEIGKAVGLPVEPDRRLRELFVGDWEGLAISELETLHKEQFDLWCVSFSTFTPPGGEAVPHLRERIYERIEEIARENMGRTVVLAFHAAAMRAFWSKITAEAGAEFNPDVPFPYNASVSVLYFDGNSFLPGEFSHMAHLTDI